MVDVDVLLIGVDVDRDEEEESGQVLDVVTTKNYKVSRMLHNFSLVVAHKRRLALFHFPRKFLRFSEVPFSRELLSL